MTKKSRNSKPAKRNTGVPRIGYEDRRIEKPQYRKPGVRYDDWGYERIDRKRKRGHSTTTIHRRRKPPFKAPRMPKRKPRKPKTTIKGRRLINHARSKEGVPIVENTLAQHRAKVQREKALEAIMDSRTSEAKAARRAFLFHPFRPNKKLKLAHAVYRERIALVTTSPEAQDLEYAAMKAWDAGRMAVGYMLMEKAVAAERIAAGKTLYLPIKASVPQNKRRFTSRRRKGGI